LDKIIVENGNRDTCILTAMAREKDMDSVSLHCKLKELAKERVEVRNTLKAKTFKQLANLNRLILMLIEGFKDDLD
jgi:hypothetical protein